jgi:hypothetical protein
MPLTPETLHHLDLAAQAGQLALDAVLEGKADGHIGLDGHVSRMAEKANATGC